MALPVWTLYAYGEMFNYLVYDLANSFLKILIKEKLQMEYN